MKSGSAIYTHDDCLLHEMNAEHPECPDRLRAVMRRLHDTRLTQDVSVLQAPLAEDTDLTRVHARHYVSALRAAVPAEGLVAADPDTLMGSQSLAAAQRAAGAVTAATRAVLAGDLQRAFCAVRPPGHHAEQSVAMGFCFFSSIAIAAQLALDEGLQRVAVLDFDVHHGNGTVDAFRDDDRVLVCSSFQHPFYPGRALDARAENIVYTPLAAGSGSETFRRALERDWVPALERHQPQLIFISAGFDAHRDDPLAEINLTVNDFSWVTRLCVAAANRHAQGRIVSALEGGYDLDALADSVQTHGELLFG